MIKVLTAEQMRRCDGAAVERYGIAEIVLMENAGVQVVEAMEEFFAESPPQTVAICCGRGHNGGDGLVVARHLHNLGRQVEVLLFGRPEELTGPVATNYRTAAAMAVPVTEIPDGDAWRSARDRLGGVDCIVDALFGTGLTRGLEGHYAEAVEAINAAPAPVVAVDLPSGLAADSGALLGPAVQADLTVAFAAPKRCHVLPPAEGCCGELAVVDIGIPQAVIEEVEEALLLLTPADCAGLLGPRSRDTHKGTYGRVLIVAGAPGTTGAAVLTGRGALRGGAGLVTVATPESVYPVVASQLTEALVRPLPAGPSGGIGEAAAAAVLELLHGADVLALGPGLGTAAETVAAVRRIAAEATVPVVVDADGLNALAGAVEVLEGPGGPRVLTPHPGEMARLMGCSPAEVQADRVGAVRALAERCGATVVLKGYRTLVAAPGGPVVVNPTGNPGMASGGTGDVLTGMIAAFLGQRLAPEAAARLAVFLHGRAGDLAAEELGEVPLVAGDLLRHLGAAIRGVEAEAEDDGRQDAPRAMG